MSNVQEVQESCGCFRVPVPIYRRRNWNFSESEEYEENMKKYEGNMKKIWRGMKEMKNMKKIWTYIMKEYEGNMKKQDLGRGLEFFPSPPDIFSKGHFRNVTSSREEGGVEKYELGGDTWEQRHETCQNEDSGCCAHCCLVIFGYRRFGIRCSFIILWSSV
mgnify:CR=1 FL=1